MKRTTLFPSIAVIAVLLVFVLSVGLTYAQYGEDPLSGTGNYQYQGGGIWTNPTTGQQAPYSQGYGGGIALPNVGLPSGTLAGVISNLTMWLLGIFGLLAIISFIISGIMYLTSAGDDQRQEKAKNQMKWSILGVIVGLSGYIIIIAVNAWLQGASNF